MNLIGWLVFLANHQAPQSHNFQVISLSMKLMGGLFSTGSLKLNLNHPKSLSYFGSMEVDLYHNKACSTSFILSSFSYFLLLEVSCVVCFLNEGPGCSSIGYGAVVELGPLIVNKNGEGLHFNPYSWNQGL